MIYDQGESPKGILGASYDDNRLKKVSAPKVLFYAKYKMHILSEIFSPLHYVYSGTIMLECGCVSTKIMIFLSSL